MMVAFTVIAGLLAAAGVLVVYMLWEARGFTITEEEVVLKRLPSTFDGVRLFFISDFHRRQLTDSHIEQILGHRRASLFLVGGDMTEQGAHLESSVENIAKLRQLGPVAAVHGNHDYKVNVRELDDKLNQLGVKMLDNEAMRLEQNGQFIWLVGWDDYSSKRTNVKLAMSEPEQEPSCTIVLTHDPLSLRKAELQGIDLVLSGHTHGGQIYLPGYGPLRTSKFYRKYLCGWHTFRGQGSTILFITKGFGTSHVPFRLLCKPEAHFITLRSGIDGRIS